MIGWENCWLKGRLNNHCSSVLLEADDFSEVAETLPAEDEVVFADESDVAGAASALSAVGAELAGVGSPEVVWHVVKIILIFYR